MLWIGVIINLQISALGIRQFAPDLVGDLPVHMHLYYIQERLLLLSWYIRFITLNKCEQSLVPQDWKLTLVVCEP